MFEKVSFYASVDDLHVNIQTGFYLLLIAENTPIPDSFFTENTRFIGGFFPSVLFGKEHYNEGIIAAKLSDLTRVYSVCMEHLSIIPFPAQSHSIFTLANSDSSHMEPFLETLYSFLPEHAKLIGGAGKNIFSYEKSCHKEACWGECALVLASTQKIGLGVKHGWEPLVSPFIANSCKGRMVEKINFKDAFSVYKDAIEKYSSLRFHTMDFEEIAQKYPLGIVRYKKDFIVRAPIQTDGSSLSLAGSLDENSVIAILQGTKTKLIEAAKEASQNALNNFENNAPSSVLLISCHARFLFLGDDFNQELETILSLYPPAMPLWGALSLGELANDNQEGIAFYNNTCVIGVLP
ncbi:FIST signal transduction protein [Sulfurospirillum barnesii]|uniref:FIST domain-containing protein n=1 Tax=Sulfurospirillum barnesii (strain ATCC 700032 / DSM 10660 / SES-3) TaxID=760154 RepID=I3XWC8_SULBS|nr:FIST C-terminal domain-containing protein [Sulfurospirillum barnesii]AFL68252.1 FIST domain-containing protein [Sulfurospirillum barnesii SES-3]